MDLEERLRKSRTVFAQRALKPGEVLPEWQRSQEVLGDADAVERFVRRSLERLGAGVEAHPRGGVVAIAPPLPDAVCEALRAEGIEGRFRFGHRLPVPAGGRLVTRSHPLVVTLAEFLLGRALEADDDPALAGETGILGRHGAWRTAAVPVRTEVYLLRLRHQLTSRRDDMSRTSLVEEPWLVARTGARDTVWHEGAPVRTWLEAPAAADLAPAARNRWRESLPEGLAELDAPFTEIARVRADALLADHRRVRTASRAQGSFQVRPAGPVDVVGAWLLLPEEGA